MARVVSWNLKQWKEQLKKRLDSAKRSRKAIEAQWLKNRSLIYDEIAGSTSGGVNLTFDNVMELRATEVDAGDSATGTNYAFKYVRFRHGQFSANPPAAIARPTSSDHKDRAAALAADALIRHGYEDGQVQELFDGQTLNTFVDGIGWIKQIWDPDRGDVFDFNEETSELTMEGDIHSYNPSTLDMFVDPVGRTWETTRYTFERLRMPLEEALFRFPEAAEAIRKSAIDSKNVSEFDTRNEHQGLEDIVSVWEYYERALPVNGMLGRHAYCLEDGTPLLISTKNPHPHGKLPYYPLTDIDVQDSVWGKSLVEYVARKQDLLNRFDSAAVDAMCAHGVIRLAVPEAAELNEDELSDSNYDIVRYSGQIPPNFINPPALPPDMARIRNEMKSDIQDTMGVNDAMLGVQKREQSGFSQQTSVEAGNINNRRMYNKYTRVVKEFWKDRIELIRTHWTIPRTILVLGKEGAFQAKYIKAADIAGGFDVCVDYGTSLPLDPNMRREQIMILMKPLTDAGVPMQRILSMLKLNELDDLYSELDQAENRQREIFEEMIALAADGEEAYIAPEELELHEPMLIFCQRYRMSMEFKTLAPDVKLLIEQHIKDRMALAADVGTKGAATPGEQTAGVAAPQPGALPPVNAQNMLDIMPAA